MGAMVVSRVTGSQTHSGGVPSGSWAWAVADQSLSAATLAIFKCRGFDNLLKMVSEIFEVGGKRHSALQSK